MNLEQLLSAEGKNPNAKEFIPKFLKNKKEEVQEAQRIPTNNIVVNPVIFVPMVLPMVVPFNPVLDSKINDTKIKTSNKKEKKIIIKKREVVDTVLAKKLMNVTSPTKKSDEEVLKTRTQSNNGNLERVLRDLTFSSQFTEPIIDLSPINPILNKKENIIPIKINVEEQKEELNTLSIQQEQEILRFLNLDENKEESKPKTVSYKDAIVNTVNKEVKQIKQTKPTIFKVDNPMEFLTKIREMIENFHREYGLPVNEEHTYFMVDVTDGPDNVYMRISTHDYSVYIMMIEKKKGKNKQMFLISMRNKLVTKGRDKHYEVFLEENVLRQTFEEILYNGILQSIFEINRDIEKTKESKKA